MNGGNGIKWNAPNPIERQNDRHGVDMKRGHEEYLIVTKTPRFPTWFTEMMLTSFGNRRFIYISM